MHNDAPRPLDRQVIVRLPSELYREAMAQARRDDRTLSAFIRLALQEYLNKSKEKKR